MNAFGLVVDTLDDFAGLVEQAKLVMGIDEGSSKFSRSVLRIEVFGPRQSHLTVVDLPGLI